MISGLLKIEGWEQLAKEAEFNPSRMATLCSISERQLQRIFKRDFHCTPSRWLRELQCRLAKDLVAQGYSSKAAAAEMKFASESHFCREFKKVYGHPPQSFAPNHLSQLRLGLPEVAAAGTQPSVRVERKTTASTQSPGHST